MTIYGSLLSGVTGLQAQGQALGMISDNISNSQTVGYKENAAYFSTLTTSSSSAQDYATGGVVSTTRQLIDTQGTLTATTNPTDLAITGRGFFAVAPKINTTTNAVATGTNTAYTRAGSFTVDSGGYLKSSTGEYLLGVPIPTGTADPTTVPVTPPNALSAINVGSIQGNASATTTLSIAANLPASAPVATDVSAGTTSAALAATAAALAFTAGSTSGSTSGTDATITDTTASPPSAFNSQVQVFDALGVAHDLTLTYVHTATDQYQVFLTKAVVHGQTTATATPATGLPVDSTNNTGVNKYDPPEPIAALTFDPSTGGLLNITDAAGKTGSAASPLIGFTPSGSTGAAAVKIALNPGAIGTTTGITQYSSTFSVATQNQNGVAFGYRTGVSVDGNGVVTAVFSNGQKVAVSRVPLVTFADPNAMLAQSGNTYLPTSASGSPTANFASTGGAGTITSNSLEGSTVDLATEFSQLITTQSAYSANTKTIQTAQQLLNELINLKQ